MKGKGVNLRDQKVNVIKYAFIFPIMILLSGIPFPIYYSFFYDSYVCFDVYMWFSIYYILQVLVMVQIIFACKAVALRIGAVSKSMK